MPGKIPAPQPWFPPTPSPSSPAGGGGRVLRGARLEAAPAAAYLWGQRETEGTIAWRGRRSHVIEFTPGTDWATDPLDYTLSHGRQVLGPVGGHRLSVSARRGRCPPLRPDRVPGGGWRSPPTKPMPSGKRSWRIWCWCCRKGPSRAFCRARPSTCASSSPTTPSFRRLEWSDSYATRRKSATR